MGSNVTRPHQHLRLCCCCCIESSELKVSPKTSSRGTDKEPKAHTETLNPKQSTSDTDVINKGDKEKTEEDGKKTEQMLVAAGGVEPNKDDNKQSGDFKSNPKTFTRQNSNKVTTIATTHGDPFQKTDMILDKKKDVGADELKTTSVLKIASQPEQPKMIKVSPRENTDVSEGQRDNLTEGATGGLDLVPKDSEQDRNNLTVSTTDNEMVRMNSSVYIERIEINNPQTHGIVIGNESQLHVNHKAEDGTNMTKLSRNIEAIKDALMILLRRQKSKKPCKLKL